MIDLNRYVTLAERVANRLARLMRPDAVVRPATGSARAAPRAAITDAPDVNPRNAPRPRETSTSHSAGDGATPATNRPPCPALWKTPVIRWDGNLQVCCADLDGHIKVGNVRDESFAKLWHGDTMTRYRLLHIEGKFDAMPMCGPCAGFNWYEMTHDEIAQYLARVGRSDLLPLYLRRMGARPTLVTATTTANPAQKSAA